MKTRVSFVCEACGYESPQWYGKCPECGEWNTLKEFKVQNSELRIENTSSLEPARIKRLSEIKYQDKNRISTGFSEVDTVLGGGIVGGSVVLLAGDPGVGKSTLLLQIALNIADKPKSKTLNNNNVLYISGEESEEQVKIRAQRIQKQKDPNLFLISETNVDKIISIIEKEKPSLVIVDSIQTLSSENLQGLSGSVGQIRYATFQFIKAAKGLGIPVVMIGHVTKEGMVAGPMVLSHMVDCVLFLEGEKSAQTRVLRSFKNRFGPVDEVGIFVMDEKGLREVSDPNFFLNRDQAKNLVGSVLVVTIEGTRPIIVEIQALAVSTKLPIPRRVASGIDSKRLELLLSVLQKHAGIPTYALDVYVNVAGGFKISDPAADLGICLAIMSSFRNVPIGSTVAIAEVGLLGELRNVPMLEKRMKEVKKLGFRKIITMSNFATIKDVVGSFGTKTGGNA